MLVNLCCSCKEQNEKFGIDLVEVTKTAVALSAVLLNTGMFAAIV